MILKIINIKFFLLSLLLGLIYIYFENDKKQIFIYPTPHNYKDIEYCDHADNCFSYDLEEVKCPSNKDNINSIPLQ